MTLYLMPPLFRALFLQRENRFLARVELDHREVFAHVPNSGRLKELLAPGKTVYLTANSSNNNRRKTCYSVLLGVRGEHLVTVDSQLANYLAGAAIGQGIIPELGSYSSMKAECICGDSRFDFLLENHEQRCWLEIKAVTLVDDGVARFPDAPTTRGRKHLRRLMQLRQNGDRAVVLFIVQGKDALRFSPNDHTDPGFGSDLRAAAAEGVEVLAYSCQATFQSINLLGKIPVDLA